MVVGGEVFGYRFGGISFVNVIQMLTETFCYHAFGFTNMASHFAQVMAYMTSLVVQPKLSLMKSSPLGPRMMLVL